jgi:lysophospholipase
MINVATTLQASDGHAELYIRQFEPVRSSQERTLVIVHGAGEHGGRYLHLAERAVREGWSVIAGDLRGHGRSGGLPAHVRSLDDYLGDLDRIWSHFRLDPGSTAVFAHSLGGLVAIRYAQTRPGRMRAMVLSAPLLGLRVPVRALTRTLGRLCLLMAPTARFNTTVRLSQITRSDDVLARRESDPLVCRSVTASWYFGVLKGLRAAHKEAARFTVPLLILQGDADQIVCLGRTRNWLSRVSSTDATLRMLPEHLHEVIHEPGWEQLIADTLQWLDRRLAAPADPSAIITSRVA